ncbi:hypothetical protein Micbo1qcDRAFT_220173 [Microdochium bolleyi]|uniref:NmrA-like domain-containing protein n=1 Tax=Microdochium bolleyi TaxID=196109 RepID=A0A136ILQ4_9PEZI|nr:hypothetical protein Micbo1qcDRAFT_220173 [Microdochium bolleyi]
MLSKKIITVLGATGTQGGSVARQFLSIPGWTVRGVTRSPSSAKAKALADRGVEIVQGDYEDVGSLEAAFAGTHAIFAVTDFYANHTRVTNDSALQEKAAAAGRSLEEYAGDLEKAQGINVAKAASNPTILSTLEKFVFSTLAPVQKISGGKYKHSWEFDSKAAAESYMRASPLNSVLSTVTMGVYQETWRDIGPFRAHKQPDGTFEFVYMGAWAPAGGYPEVVASRDTGAFVEALVLRHPPGTHVLGVTEFISKPEYAALWGRTLGVTATARDVSEEEYARYLTPGMETSTLLDDLRFFGEFGYTGGNPEVKTPKELGIKTASLEDYFKSEDWSLVLDEKV